MFGSVLQYFYSFPDCSRSLSLTSKTSTAAAYRNLNPAIDVLDEIRPVNIETREIETNQRALLLRLPESDQVKSNVRRITISGLTPAIGEIQVGQEDKFLL